MIRPFHYAPAPQRVAFGVRNLAEVADEVEPLGPAFVVASSDRDGLASRVAALVGAPASACFFRAAPHTPVAVTEQAVSALQATGAACLVSVGGGSATGLAKALAHRRALPIVAVPTTYAGSELTSILGQSDGARKWTLRDEAVRPGSVVYDVALTHALPARLSAASGCNALAHAVEALWARDATPVHVLLAEAAIEALAGALPLVVADGDDGQARAAALYGAFLAGTCLGACEMALHHRICHVLGGRFGLPHAETHAIVLPHVVALYGPGEAGERLAGALGTEAGEAASALFSLTARLGLPRGLHEVGLPAGAEQESASLVLGAGGYSPVLPSLAELTEVLGRAARGEPPRGMASLPERTRLS